MEEQTLEISVAGLLPEIDAEAGTAPCAGCLRRLTDSLEQKQGIHRAHIKTDKNPLGLCLHYDPEVLNSNDAQKLAENAGRGLRARYAHRSLTLEGLDCSDCALVVEHSLERMPGVLEATVDFSASKMWIEFDRQRTSQRAIRQRIQHLGYSVVRQGPVAWLLRNQELLMSLAGGLALLAGWLLDRLMGQAGPWNLAGMPVSLLFYLGSYGLSGYEATQHSLEHLRRRELDTHLLMLAAALGAAALGQWAEGALLLFLFSLGHALEERAADQAQAAIRALGNLAPRWALVQRQSNEILLPVEQVQIGDIVIVRAGERIPVDGVIIAGQSAVDQSPVTGESMPVDKAAGAPVFAGTVNGENVLEVQANRLAKDSTLRRMQELVQEAQAQASPTQQTAERFMQRFTPVVLIGVLLLVIVPPAFGVSFTLAFQRAMTLLVAVSPCALAIGTPSAVLAGIAQAARHGILIKGGMHLENLGRLKALAFDKTGTLTEGRPRLVGILPLLPMPDDQILRLAAALESRSAHPLARAVTAGAEEHQLTLPGVEAPTSLNGRGLYGRIEGQRVVVGNADTLAGQGIPLNAALHQQVAEMEAQGQLSILVGIDGQAAGILSLADALRPGTVDMLAELKRLGVARLVMLSGDTPAAAARIAGRLGLDEFQAGLSPQDKLSALRQLNAQYGCVAMVGDGINDAPALAAATVGIAMGGAGAAAALETASVALLADDLGQLPFAIGLGRAARRIITQNLVVAIGVMIALAGLALSGLAGIGPAIVFHEGSTLLVAINSLRLLRYHPAD